MFISIGQRVETDSKYTQIRVEYMAESGLGPRVRMAYGYGDAILFDIDEAKRLFLELEVALRDAYDNRDEDAA